jgi:DNA-directed RNA polymerase subunit omega
VDRETFDGMIEGGRFLEWAEFLGERYGTPWPDAPAGSDVLLEIDLQGAEQVRDRYADAVLLLLLPPSPEIQAERLRMRGEDPETIAARLAVGRVEELRGSQIADAIVVNDDIERAVAEVGGILARYRTPVAHQPGGDPPRRIPMARRRPTLMDPPVEELLNKVDSKFTLVALSSKRARQINSYYNQLGESLGVIVPPQVTSVSGKPLTIAFEEIASAKTTYHRTDLESDGEGGEPEPDVVAVSATEVVEAPAAAPEELTLTAVADVESTDPAADSATDSAADADSGAPAAEASVSGDVVSEAPVSPEAVEPPAPTG